MLHFIGWKFVLILSKVARPCNLGCSFFIKQRHWTVTKLDDFPDPQPICSFVVTVGQGFPTTGRKGNINLLEKLSALTDRFRCTERWRLIFCPTSLLDPKSWPGLTLNFFVTFNNLDCFEQLSLCCHLGNFTTVDSLTTPVWT